MHRCRSERSFTYDCDTDVSMDMQVAYHCFEVRASIHRGISCKGERRGRQRPLVSVSVLQLFTYRACALNFPTLTFWRKTFVANLEVFEEVQVSLAIAVFGVLRETARFQSSLVLPAFGADCLFLRILPRASIRRLTACCLTRRLRTRLRYSVHVVQIFLSMGPSACAHRRQPKHCAKDGKVD